MKFDNISLLVPYKPDGSYRQRNWEWIRKRHEILMPGVEVCIGDSITKPYSRAQAINSAAKKATRDIFIIADADLVFDIKELEKAIELLDKYYFVLPFSKLVKMTEGKTEKLLNDNFLIETDDIDIEGCKIDDKTGCMSPGAMTGGMCIIKRKTFENIGGYDKRLKGWGGEDNIFFISIRYMYGLENMVRTESTIWHLFHKYSTNYKSEELRNKNIDLIKSMYGSEESILNSIIENKKNNGYK